jgi:hypothetical protein
MIVITAELVLTFFTFAYIIVETTIFIKDHMRQGTKEVVEEKQVIIAS